MDLLLLGKPQAETGHWADWDNPLRSLAGWWLALVATQTIALVPPRPKDHGWEQEE